MQSSWQDSLIGQPKTHGHGHGLTGIGRHLQAQAMPNHLHLTDPEKDHQQPCYSSKPVLATVKRPPVCATRASRNSVQPDRLCLFSGLKLLSTLLLLSCQTVAIGQSQRFINYAIEDGLPSEIIYAITQSQSGYMWFGSDAGITRFDGDQFQSLLLNQVTASDNHANPGAVLPGASVQYLHSDGAMVYAALESAGLALLDENMNVQQVLNPDNTPSMSSSNIWSMAQAGPDQIWIGFADTGLALFNTRDLSFTSQALMTSTGLVPANQSMQSIIYIHTDAQQTTWVSTRRLGLFRKTAQDKHFMPVELPPDSNTLRAYIRTMSHDEQHVFAINGAYLFVLDAHTAKITAIFYLSDYLPREDQLLTSIMLDKRGNVWIGSRQGLYRITLDAQAQAIQSVDVFHHSPALQDSIASNNIYFNYRDSDDGLWFASMIRGIVHMPDGWDAVSMLRNDPLDANSLPGERARSLLVDGDELWIGTFNQGMARYNYRSNTYTTPAVLAELATNPLNKRVTVMGQDQQARLWIGSVSQLRYYRQDLGLHLTAMEPALAKLMQNRVLFGVFTAGKRLWALSESRDLIYYDDEHAVWRPYQAATPTVTGQNNSIIDFSALADGRVLLASTDELLQYTPDCDCIDNVIAHSELPIQSMTVADDQLYLVRGQLLEQYQTRTGLPTLQQSWRLPESLTQSQIINLLTSDGNTIWLTDKQHIFRLVIDPETNNIASTRTISRSDGLANTEIERNMLVRLNDGRLAVATTRGVALLQPDNLVDKYPVPEVQLQHLRTPTKTIALPQTQDDVAGRQVLSYQENTLFIGFQSILFNYRELLEFQYRLQGWDENWLSNDSSNQAVYSNLPHGQYQFQVRARIGDNAWGPINQQLQFTIQRPPWLSTPAMLVYVTIALSLLWLGWLRHRRNLDQQQALALARERQQLASQQTELVTRLNRSIEPDQIAAALFKTINKHIRVHSMHINFLATVDQWYNFPKTTAPTAMDASDLYRLLEQSDGEQSDGIQSLDQYAASGPAPLLVPLGSKPPYHALALIYLSEQADPESLSFVHLTGTMAATAVNNFELLQQVTELAENSRMANQAKSEFIAMVSHEIRTPLHGLMGMIHLMSTNQEPDQRESMLIKVNRSTEQLLTVVDDVLDISKIEAKKIELREELFDLHMLCTGIEDLFLGRVQEKNIYLVCLQAPDLINWRIGDQDRCMQILTNLVSNAIKFTDTGGVMVCIRNDPQRPGEKVLIEVSDTGIGIKQDDQRRLFQRFEQIGHMTWQRYGGSGLGLAISHHLSQLLGGELSVHSQPGHGSIFSTSLKLSIPASLQHIQPLQARSPLLLHIACGPASAGIAACLQGIATSRVLDDDAQPAVADDATNIYLTYAAERAEELAASMPTALLQFAPDAAMPSIGDRKLARFRLSGEWQDLIAWLLAAAAAPPPA